MEEFSHQIAVGFRSISWVRGYKECGLNELSYDYPRECTSNTSFDRDAGHHIRRSASVKSIVKDIAACLHFFRTDPHADIRGASIRFSKRIALMVTDQETVVTPFLNLNAIAQLPACIPTLSSL